MKTALIQGPERYPVTLGQVKEYCRIEDSSSDVMLMDFLRLAVEMVENIAGRKIISQKWKLSLDSFSEVIELPYPSLISVDSVKYFDSENQIQILSTDIYNVVGSGTVGSIALDCNASFPAIYSKPEAVEIEFTCGYSDVEKVPECIKSAIYTVVWDMFNARGEGVSNQIKSVVEYLLGSVMIKRFY